MDTVERVAERGFAIVPGVLSHAECDRTLAAMGDFTVDGAGSRTSLNAQWCQDIVQSIRNHPEMAAVLSKNEKAVQCTYFYKSPEKNWLVSLHQDLSVPVDERIANENLTGWSKKEGRHYVQPPAEFLETLVGVRIHLDDCGEANGPLRVVPISHRHGRLNDSDARELRDKNGECACIVPRGGALVLKPLLLHASSKASASSHRRVLHFLFGPQELPYGLRWPNDT